MNIIEKNSSVIMELCRKHHVGRLFAFGSVLTNRFGNESDIDLLVDFAGIDLYDYADNYFDFKTSLENLFQHKVDLLEDKAIKNPFLRQSIDSTKRLIYGS